VLEHRSLRSMIKGDVGKVPVSSRRSILLCYLHNFIP
jgi:hypothetical protein